MNEERGGGERSDRRDLGIFKVYDQDHEPLVKAQHREIR